MNNHNPVPVLYRIVLTLLLFFLPLVIARSAPKGPEQPAEVDTSIIKEAESYALGVFEKIKAKGAFVEALNLENIGTLPVGLVREINGKVYVIAIDSVRMTPKGAYFSAYFRFTFPGTNSELIFGGKNIFFTPGGIGAGTSTKLVLLNNKNVHINEHLDLLFPGDGSNYIEWDCNGFKAANLSGVFEFDKGWIEPEDPNADKLRASLKVNVHDLNNILATIDLPAFHITKLKDFSFKVKNATVDMSDIANPTTLNVTGDMVEDPGNPLLWRGFYLQQIEVGLPSQMASAEGRPKVSVDNFYIDDQGVSGTISAENIVKLGGASASGWPLSIDKVGLSFSKNKLNGGVLGGQLKVAFLGEDPLDYDAAVSMRNGDTYYSFAIATTAEKKFGFFAGNIILNKGCRIEVTKTDKDFIPKATLAGKVELNKSVLNIKGVAFEDLVLSTQKPYVHSGTFDIATAASDSKMGGFPVGFDKLHIGISEGKVAIGATVRLNFMNSSDKGFGGSTSFVITALQEEKKETVMVNNAPVEKTSTKWKLDKVTINEIKLAVKVTAFQLDGSLTIFDDHPVYGNGFRGSLDLTIPGPVPRAKATAYFGSKDDYKYWHVDAYIGVTIPLPPMLQITGLMGGMSYHMERPSDFDPYDTRNSLDQKGGMKDLSEIFQYVPSKDAGLGFMAGVSLAFLYETVVNANVALEVQFGTDGGFRYAQFDGAGYVLHEAVMANSQDDAKEDASAPAWVQFKMRFDNVNKSFDANMKTYINIAGVIKGIHERGLVGEAAFHLGQGDWWFYIGRPSSMFGLSILGLAETKSYFMMGTKVEDMPPLPTEVSEVFDDINTDFMAAENAFSTGRGFGFGNHFRAGFKFDYGVYGEFAIGAGADILLRNYGEARCKGSGSPLGFDGWYASGQAYAFLKGDVGIRVKVFGRKRGFSIAKLSAAVLLQAKLPNPSWFRGMVGVKYRILGGMIKGTASIKVELGSQCEIVGAKELDIQVISEIRPENAVEDVSVFAPTQVAFNMAIGQPFEMLNNFDIVSTYRIKLDEIKLKKGDTEIRGEITVEPDGKSATLTQHDILPPLSKLDASAMIHIEKQSGSAWEPLKTNDKVEYESKAVSFTTGEAPNYVPWENIAYAYPIRNQYNFLPKEYRKGYMKLKIGQPYLFTPVDDAGKKWKVTASFNPPQGAPVEGTVSYEQGVAQINFDIPANLSRETIYTYSIMRSSADGESAANNVNVNVNTTTGDGDTTSIAQTSLKGDANSGISKEVIACTFRTSRYTTFAEKMSAVTDPRDLFDVATGYVGVVGQRFTTDETFDKFEIEGDGSFSTKPLILLKAGLNNSWLQTKILPLLYNGYPFAPSLTFSRDLVTTGGIPPLEAVRLYNNDDATMYKLEESAIKDGVALSKPGRCRFMYYLSYVAHEDYMEVLNKASRLYVNGAGASNTRIVNLLQAPSYPDLQGNIYYPVELQYRLPGSNYVSSTITKSIYYKL